MPSAFDKFGIHFQYPENWSLEAEEASVKRQAVSVYSPGGAFWTVMLHPLQSDPIELARATLTAMRREYQELDSEAVREEIGEIELVGFDLNFYCLDLTNTAWIRAGRTSSASLLLICQAEDREFNNVADVFRAITASLLAASENKKARPAL